MSGRSVLLAPSRQSVITSHQQWGRTMLGWWWGGGKRRQHPYQRPGFWASDKNSNRGRLASISAGVDGPIDSSTAASGCWAIEGIRQTAYDEMRSEDNFWQALHPPPISNHPVCTHTEKVITTCMHVLTDTHTHLPAPWASNGTLAGWASTCPVSTAKSKLMCSHTYKIPLDVPQQSAATVLKGYHTKLSCTSK